MKGTREGVSPTWDLGSCGHRLPPWPIKDCAECESFGKHKSHSRLVFRLEKMRMLNLENRGQMVSQ